MERELREIEDDLEREEFLKDMGIDESALDKVIHATYELLGLITFFDCRRERGKGMDN